MRMLFTVALCTHNHIERLVRTLNDLAVLRMPRSDWELLIIDNASTDGTASLLLKYPWPKGWRVRVAREDNLGLSNARNRAIKESRGAYTVFLDDDETVDAEWLCAYERLVLTEQPDAFGGRICVLFEDDRPDWLADELLGFLGELNRSENVTALTSDASPFYGGNFGFRTKLPDKIGGFNPMLGRKGEDNTGGEEIDFYRRLLRGGYRVFYSPEAVIHHRIQASKLSRRYFIDLHYRMGRIDAIRQRGTGSRMPPRYLFGQLARSVMAVYSTWRVSGRRATVRKEMNVSYFYGLITGWMFAPRWNT